MTLVVVLYLCLAWATGVCLTLISRMPWHLEGRLAAGLPLGFSAAALVTWMVAIPFGMSVYPVLLGAVLMSAFVAATALRSRLLERLRVEAEAMRRRWRGRDGIPLLIAVILAAIFFIPFYGHALRLLPDPDVPGTRALYAGYVNIWGDWSTHLSLAGYLATARHLLPPENPFFSGTNLTYSFLPDLFSGMLGQLGMSLPDALVLVSLVLSLALVVVFFSTALRLTGNRWSALIATVLLFLSGGLGFLRVFKDSAPPGGCGAGGSGILGLIGAPPCEYTLDRAHDYEWLNPVLAYLVPQRTTLFGWALGLIVLSLLWYGWNTRSRREMLIGGILLGLIPLFHIATYIDLGVISGGLCAIGFLGWLRLAEAGSVSVRPAQGWVLFLLPALLLGVPAALLILPHASVSHSFIRLQLGWMAPLPRNASGLVDFSSTGWSRALFTWGYFWILNTAFLIPLALATFLSPRWGKPRLRQFLLPAWLLFLISNVVILAPWDWDNTKYLSWWAMLMCIAAGVALQAMMRTRTALGILAALMLAGSTASGALDLDRAAQARLNQPSLKFLTADELAVGRWARTATPVGSVFLTGWQHNHPILTMSGRVEVMGYFGWIWSWGIDGCPRERDVTRMYAGGPDAAGLIRHYNVAYVVVGPEEVQHQATSCGNNGPGANVAAISSTYPVVYTSPRGDYKVFKVS